LIVIGSLMFKLICCIHAKAVIIFHERENYRNGVQADYL
jgi:hypothetical protein